MKLSSYIPQSDRLAAAYRRLIAKMDAITTMEAREVLRVIQTLHKLENETLWYQTALMATAQQVFGDARYSVFEAAQYVMDRARGRLLIVSPYPVAAFAQYVEGIPVQATEPRTAELMRWLELAPYENDLITDEHFKKGAFDTVAVLGDPQDRSLVRRVKREHPNATILAARPITSGGNPIAKGVAIGLEKRSKSAASAASAPHRYPGPYSYVGELVRLTMDGQAVTATGTMLTDPEGRQVVIVPRLDGDGFDMPGAWSDLGQATSIHYRSDQFRSADGADYSHSFTTPPNVYEAEGGALLLEPVTLTQDGFLG